MIQGLGLFSIPLIFSACNTSAKPSRHQPSDTGRVDMAETADADTNADTDVDTDVDCNNTNKL